MRKIQSIICSVLVLLSTTFGTKSNAEERYVVTHVYDGDTVELSNTKGRIKMRLSEIDAPEHYQAYNKKARLALVKLCQNKHTVVKVQTSGSDQYHRVLGTLQCNDTNVGLYLVKNGWAWHYVKYSNNPILHHAEQYARQHRLGLWADNNPTPPWVWRRKHPRL